MKKVLFKLLRFLGLRNINMVLAMFEAVHDELREIVEEQGSKIKDKEAEINELEKEIRTHIDAMDRASDVATRLKELVK